MTVEEELLLCDEEPFLLSSPSNSPIMDRNCCFGADCKPNSIVFSCQEEERDELFLGYLRREKSYCPCVGYLNRLQVSRNLCFARSKAVQYVVHVCDRLNLNASTAFNAANYLDRFLSMNSCMNWETWMVELLSIACLSLSCKLDEVYIPSLHDLQMENLEHKFKPSTIEEMEIMVLKTLNWRLSCVTPFAYVDLLSSAMCKSTLSSITNVLLHSLSDPIILKFSASVIAISAFRCVMIGHDAKKLTKFTRLIRPDGMGEVEKCMEIMKIHCIRKKQWSPVSVISAQFFTRNK